MGAIAVDSSGGTAQWASKQNNVNPKWWKDPGLRINNLWAFFLFGSMYSYGYDGSLLGGLQIMPQWNEFFGNPSGSDLGLISASVTFAAIIFNPVAAWACDKWGRKPPIVAGIIFCIVGGVVQAFGGNIEAFIGGRAVVGLGGAFLLNPSITLLAEITHPKYRGATLGIFFSTFYLGAIVAAWATFGTLRMAGDWAWKLPALLQCLASVIQLLFVWWLPESPRWLAAQGRHDEALQLLARFHGNGDVNDELVRFEMAEIQEALKLEASTQTGWLDLFRTSANRRRMWVVCCVATFGQMSGAGIISYYLAPILRTIGIVKADHQALISGGLQIWNGGWALAASLVADKVPRRTLWLSATTIMLVSYVILTALSARFAETGQAALGYVVVVFLFIYFLGYDIAFTALASVYPSEILSSPMRAKGLGVNGIIGNAWLCFGQYVNPIALEAIAWKYYLVYIVILVCIFLVIYFTYPETVNMSLEEIAVLFDGPEAAEGMRHAEEKVVEESYRQEKSEAIINHNEHRV